MNVPDPRLRRQALTSLIRSHIPTLAEASVATASALLLVLSFPDFDLWPLAWIGLAPLILVSALCEKPMRAFVAGWCWGAIFFYGSCWWLTYPMVHYGHITPWLAYPLLLLPVALVAVFPALFCAFVNRLVMRFGYAAVLSAPLVWVSLELARYKVTGQVWNAIGYSQSFHPFFIQSARWGGVYAVGFLLLTSNALITFALLSKSVLRIVTSAIILSIILFIVGLSNLETGLPAISSDGAAIRVVAVQPNVPMDDLNDAASTHELLNRHLQLSASGLNQDSNRPAMSTLVIWPESPMNFDYSRDSRLQKLLVEFTQSHQVSLLLNSLEPATGDGQYNSAILINEQGQKAAQYDKIRLMPFGEYVPLPRWLPGARSVRAIVGEFTPGSSYTLMPLGDLRAGVFICIEAAHPGIARTFTNEGADVLINISNDGYLGPTAVMRQHLANAVFRAVENDRPLLRVTNSGISASIDSHGRVLSSTAAFQPDVQVWYATRGTKVTTFYSRHSDLFAYACALITLGFISASFVLRNQKSLYSRG